MKGDRPHADHGDRGSADLTARVAGASTPLVVGVCVLLALALRMPFLRVPLGSDEAGLLLVVRHWDPGSGLYGDYWVDRPPLLLATFWFADLLADDELGVRLMGCLVSVGLVTSAVVAGRLLGGRCGGWAAGLVSAAVGSSYLVVGHQANGMVQGAALTTAGCALCLSALQHSDHPARLWLTSVAAGCVGTAAVLVKQSFFGALVFGVVVLLAAVVTGRLRPRQALNAAAAGLTGALATLVAVAWWAVATDVDIGGLWYAAVQFRADATGTLTGASMGAQLDRIASLSAALVASGLGLFVPPLVLCGRQVHHERAVVPQYAGIVALVVVASVAIVLGGSWWRHYLLQLVPSAALAAALLAPRAGRIAATMRAAVAFAVVSSVLAAGVGVAYESTPPPEVAVGRYVGAAALPGDSAFVAWGHAELLLYGELTSPYPHLWSLPARTLDPDLDRLVGSLRGPEPPTWVVRINSFDSWDIDRGGRLSDAIEERYRKVASVCEADVYLLRGQERRLPEPSQGC